MKPRKKRVPRFHEVKLHDKDLISIGQNYTLKSLKQRKNKDPQEEVLDMDEILEIAFLRACKMTAKKKEFPIMT